MRHNGIVPVVATLALVLGVAACGSSEGTDSGSSGGSSGGTSSKLGGALNGAGAPFPQPVYQEWAAREKEAQGPTLNYQGIGSRGGNAPFTPRAPDLRAAHAPEEGRGGG